MNEGFARAAIDLMKDGSPVNAVDPTPGLGLTLDKNGRIPNAQTVAPTPAVNKVLVTDGSGVMSWGGQSVVAGTAASRAAASSSNSGQFYFETDTGTMFYSTGSAWTPLNNRAIGCRVNHGSNQSISNSTITTLAFGAERFDTNGFHDTATNNSRVTVPSGLAGVYLITANVEFADSAAGRRAAWLNLNGSTNICAAEVEPNTTGVGNRIVLSTVYDLAAADYVEVQVFQSSGGALNVLSSANFSPEFSAMLIGRK